jgi:outer membrane protein OmpA-like peptidoglycan-associated protein
MKNYIKIMLLLCIGSLNAQDAPVQKVYFELNKHTLDKQQIQTVVDFIKKTDTAQIESIQIYGYCDDRGNDNYNCKLSKKRANTIQKILASNGIPTHKNSIIEEKGRVILNKDTVKNLSETRSKNRRVDLIIVKKNKAKNNPGFKSFYNSIQENHKIGDRIFFDKILFDLGSSVLTIESKKELDKIAGVLQKHQRLQFEIRGHVCCTPGHFPDAIDQKTYQRNLSVNRAKNVYNYLLSKNINSDRMTYNGYGNKFPQRKGDRFDRRVEFLILKI